MYWSGNKRRRRYIYKVAERQNRTRRKKNERKCPRESSGAWIVLETISCLVRRVSHQRNLVYSRRTAGISVLAPRNVSSFCLLDISRSIYLRKKRRNRARGWEKRKSLERSEILAGFSIFIPPYNGSCCARRSADAVHDGRASKRRHRRELEVNSPSNCPASLPFDLLPKGTTASQ